MSNKIKSFQGQDMNAIKKEISDNSRLFVLNVIKSLKLKKQQPFSEYKVDLSLFYLKQLYERIFPQKRHGANLLSTLNKTNFKGIRSETVRVTESVTLRNGVSIHDRSIVINLLEGVKIRGQVPNFVKLISIRSSLSRTTIQRRIRVGKFLIGKNNVPNLVLNYKKGLISHSQIQNEIS